MRHLAQVSENRRVGAKKATATKRAKQGNVTQPAPAKKTRTPTPEELEAVRAIQAAPYNPPPVTFVGQPAPATFEQRIAAAKKKLADIYARKDADYAPGEIRDMKQFEGLEEPIIDPLYKEFLSLIAPKGYSVMKAHRGWLVQEIEEEEQAEPVTKPKFVPPSERKRTAHATKTLLESMASNFKDNHKDDHSQQWAINYRTAFEAHVAMDGWYHAQPVKAERERIERMIAARDVRNQAHIPDTSPGKKSTAKKTHVVARRLDTIPDSTMCWTYCSKRGDDPNVLIAAEGERPTCLTCLNHPERMNVEFVKAYP
jgi:hypothetical protein